MTAASTRTGAAIDAAGDWAGGTGRLVSPLQTFGRTVRLAGRVVVLAVGDTLRLRLPFRDLVIQAWFYLSVTALPALLLSVPIGVIMAVQVGNITSQLGAQSMSGAAGAGVMQQAAPLVAALLIGGAGASAVASDLGARTIRDETDAMRTMGIDPHQRLVVPRVIAMTMVAPMLSIIITFVTVLASFLVAVVWQGIAVGSYWLSFGMFATVTDIFFGCAKAALFGFIVAVVASERGLNVAGGPRGVATGVNASVVIGVLSCMVVNVFITQLQFMFFPPTVF